MMKLKDFCWKPEIKFILLLILQESFTSKSLLNQIGVQGNYFRHVVSNFRPTACGDGGIINSCMS